jgi:site-specific recombinase XerC
MAPDRSPATFFQEFLASPKKEAILLVLEWQQRLLKEGKASGTINQRISALKSLVEYAGRQEACNFSLREIKSLKSQSYKDTRGVSVEDYRSILAQVVGNASLQENRTTDLGSRNYAMLRLLWDNALRREEVVSLDLMDYRGQDGRLMILGKGRVDREPIDLNGGVREAICHSTTLRERGLVGLLIGSIFSAEEWCGEGFGFVFELQWSQVKGQRCFSYFEGLRRSGGGSYFSPSGAP